MKNATIKKAEAELSRIWELRQEMKLYKDSSLKNALLLSCDICEEIWKRELRRLRMNKTQPIKEEFPELLTRKQLEEMASSIHSSDPVAHKALLQQINNRCMN